MIVFQIVNNISIDNFGGGAEMFALRLAEKLSEDQESHVIAVWHYGTEKEKQIKESLNEKVKFHFLFDALPRKEMNFFTLHRKLHRIFALFPPSIVNSHSALPDVINIFIKVFINHKVKVVRTMHTDINWMSESFLEACILNLFPIFFDSEVAISKATKNRLDNRFIAKLVRKQSEFIPNGISEEVMNYLKENPTPERVDDHFKLVTVGRLTEQKGYKYLIEAMKILVDCDSVDDKKYYLFILGDGHLKNELLELTTNLDLTKNIQFLGFREDVLQIMASSDLFISSSLWEGIPTVLLEAMALCVPIIATDIPGTREIIVDQQTGILVEPKNPEQLARAIIKFVSDPVTSVSLVKKSSVYVRDYSMLNIKEKYLVIYGS